LVDLQFDKKIDFLLNHNQIKGVSMKGSIVLAIVCALGFTACQSMPYQPYARDVKKKPSAGGVIALKMEHRDEDMQKAQMMMANTCGTNPVKVVEEGEVAVGQATTSNATKEQNAGSKPMNMGTLFGLPVTSGGSNPNEATATNSVTTAVKEWQISYECENQKTAVVPAVKKTH
jgi:hypothetical protein